MLQRSSLRLVAFKASASSRCALLGVSSNGATIINSRRALVGSLGSKRRLSVMQERMDDHSSSSTSTTTTAIPPQESPSAPYGPLQGPRRPEMQFRLDEKVRGVARMCFIWLAIGPEG